MACRSAPSAPRPSVSVGLINHHFPNKDELVAAAYRHFNSELVGGLQAAVAGATGLAARAAARFLEASFSPPNLDGDVLAVWVVFWGLYRHSQDIQRVQQRDLPGLRRAAARNARGPGTGVRELRFDLRLAAIGLRR